MLNGHEQKMDTRQMYTLARETRPSASCRLFRLTTWARSAGFFY
ncbi:MAG: hypothetical protein SGI73_09850 [Chloroflexota bacterium]|nr:hypothetical protein [Chloroflexota bacterium]